MLRADRPADRVHPAVRELLLVPTPHRSGASLWMTLPNRSLLTSLCLLFSRATPFISRVPMSLHFWYITTHLAHTPNLLPTVHQKQRNEAVEAKYKQCLAQQQQHAAAHITARPPSPPPDASNILIENTLSFPTVLCPHEHETSLRLCGVCTYASVRPHAFLSRSDSSS